MNKLQEFESHINLYKVNIIAITKICCPTLLRKDKGDSHGGSVYV